MFLDRFVWRLTPPKNVKAVKAVPAAQFARGPSKGEMVVAVPSPAAVEISKAKETVA